MKKPIRGIDDSRILIPTQSAFLKEFAKSELKDIFRLTGGTALSAFYLEHRLSEDLDFFSSEKIPSYIPEEFLKSLDMIDGITHTKLFDRNIFNLNLNDGSALKIEFTYYPLKNFENPFAIDNLLIDSFIDIVVNKLCTIADRFDAKDYVDVYCALKKSDLVLEDLTVLAEKKCEIKGIKHILKNRLLQIPDGIENLPLMIPIKKKDIKDFFGRLIRDIVAKEIGEG